MFFPGILLENYQVIKMKNKVPPLFLHFGMNFTHVSRRLYYYIPVSCFVTLSVVASSGEMWYNISVFLPILDFCAVKIIPVGFIKTRNKSVIEIKSQN